MYKVKIISHKLFNEDDEYCDIGEIIDKFINKNNYELITLIEKVSKYSAETMWTVIYLEKVAR